MVMQHHDVFVVDEHDPCPETKFCRRCGLHTDFAKERGYQCAFSLNLIAITHLRALAIEAEKERKRQDATRNFILKVRELRDKITTTQADVDDRISAAIEQLSLRELEPKDG